MSAFPATLSCGDAAHRAHLADNEQRSRRILAGWRAQQEQRLRERMVAVAADNSRQSAHKRRGPRHRKPRCIVWRRDR